MVRLEWSDEDLTKRLYERDPKALEALISRYSREVFGFIRLILNGVGGVQDAEECLNDLFITVWQEIDTFDATRGTFHAWLIMRAKYIALDRRRQLCRCQMYNIQSADEMSSWHLGENNGNGASSVRGYDLGRARLLSPPEASMENLLEQSERREELGRALAELPELDRFLIYQRYFRFATTEELATKTGLTRHAVDTRLWRARKNLRNILQGELLCL